MCVLLITAVFATYCYSNMVSDLKYRAETTTEFFAEYLNQSYNEYYQSCITYAQTFEERNHLELQFINTGGSVEISTYGITAGTSPGTPEINEAIKSKKISTWMGKSPTTGERIIAVSSPMIYSNGEVVGVVTEVGPNYSVIKTVLDSSLEISATIAASGHSGMVQGGYASGLDGLLRMNYLPSSATIRNHDQVVTTGSTVYPRNLVLGHVVDAGFDDTGVAKYALLQPAADVRSVEQVFIVTEYNAG